MVVNSPLAQTLSEIGLEKNRIGNDIAAALARQQQKFPRLNSISLSETALTQVGIQTLIDSGLLERIESLDIGLNPIGHMGIEMIGDSPDSARIKTLDASNNNLGGPGVIQAIVNSKYLRPTAIGFVGNDMGPETGQILSSYQAVSNLRKL